MKDNKTWEKEKQSYLELLPAIKSIAKEHEYNGVYGITSLPDYKNIVLRFDNKKNRDSYFDDIKKKLTSVLKTVSFHKHSGKDNYICLDTDTGKMESIEYTAYYACIGIRNDWLG